MHEWAFRNWYFIATRLVNGSDQYTGRVEVFNGDNHHTDGVYPIFAQQWGTICDSEWNETDANVVCRSLGYRSTDAIPHAGGMFGAGEGPIWANNVTCVGTEYYPVDCQIDSRYGYNGGAICNHTTDIGVTCSGICIIINVTQHDK